MTPEEFKKRLSERKDEIADMVRTKAPRIVGVRLVGFFKENYRKGGYMSNGFHKWPITRRQTGGEVGALGKYGPLMSKRNRMWSATDYTPQNSAVIIHNNTPYAAVHNDGGMVPITKKSRKYFWAMYYGKGGKDGGSVADKYKWMALTKKKAFKIPQRQFIYDSREARDIIYSVLKDETKKILIQ